MPRKPKITIGKLFNRYFSSSAIRQTLYPLMNYSRCESPAFVRKALNHAIKKTLNQFHRMQNLFLTLKEQHLVIITSIQKIQSSQLKMKSTLTKHLMKPQLN